MTCPLCRLEKKTQWFYQDRLCAVIECSTCKVPMVVYREHREPNDNVKSHMVNTLMKIGQEQIPDGYVDFERRAVPEHWHAHWRAHGN